jgi:imidazolonepropionase-like amidohydrolase
MTFLTNLKIMKNSIYLLIGVLLSIADSTFYAQSKGILLTGGVIHTGNDKVIENAVMGIRDGKIEFAGSGTTIKYDKRLYAEQIDFTGQHIYPGFIALNSSIGLREIDAVRATLDVNEVGYLNPHIRSMPAFNTDSRIIPTVRSNGVLMVQATPAGGIISGSSSLFHLDGWNWEDALIKADDGLHLNWPEYPVAKANKDSSKTDHIQKKQVEIIDFIKEARAYGLTSEKKEINLRFGAMQGLFNGSQRLFVHCQKARSITDAILMLQEAGIKKLVIVGGAEADQTINLLRKFDVPVVLSRIHRLPDYEDDPIDKPFRLPAILSDSGIMVALSYDGDMEAMGTRNLAFTAGTAAAYGCGKELALKLITLNPAKIVGIQAQTGSIEAGKNADFILSKGDVLDPITADIIKLFIGGKEVNTANHQSELNKKYCDKYGLPLK